MIMKDELILQNNKSLIYLQPVTLIYEQIREYLKSHLNNFDFISQIDSELMINNHLSGSFFSLNDFNGLVIEKEEIKARNQVMDLLSLFKKTIKDLFYLEAIDAKFVHSKEVYSVIIVGTSFTYSLVDIKIEFLDQIIVNISFNNIFDFISSLLIDFKNQICPFNISNNQIGIALLQSNHPEVISMSKKIAHILSNYRIHDYFINQNYLEEESKLLVENALILVEIGPRNVKKNQVTLISKLEKNIVKFDDIESCLLKMINNLNNEVYRNSLKRVFTFQKNQKEIDLLKKGNRFACCLDSNCVDKVKKQTGGEKIYQSFSNINSSNHCIVCGKIVSKTFFLI